MRESDSMFKVMCKVMCEGRAAYQDHSGLRRHKEAMHSAGGPKQHKYDEPGCKDHAGFSDAAGLLRHKKTYTLLMDQRSTSAMSRSVRGMPATVMPPVCQGTKKANTKKSKQRIVYKMYTSYIKKNTLDV
jgi:hypothetical protein